MITNTLLALIALLLLARVIIEVRSGKRAVEKTYAQAYDVANIVKMVNVKSPFEIKDELGRASADNWELVAVEKADSNYVYLFFTRKKIKNYYEE